MFTKVFTKNKLDKRFLIKDKTKKKHIINNAIANLTGPACNLVTVFLLRLKTHVWGFNNLLNYLRISLHM